MDHLVLNKAYRDVTLREFVAFYEEFSLKTENWPGVPDHIMAELIGLSLIKMGEKRGLGSSMAQAAALEILDVVLASNGLKKRERNTQKEIRDPLISEVLSKFDNVESSVKKIRDSNEKKIYKNSLMSLYYTDRPADTDLECIVVVGENKIELKYDQEDGQFWSWKGELNSPGHYLVYANYPGSRGTLHHLEQMKYLEGYWVENGYRGMWRIQLED